MRRIEANRKITRVILILVVNQRLNSLQIIYKFYSEYLFSESDKRAWRRQDAVHAIKIYLQNNREIYLKNLLQFKLLSLLCY